MTETTFSHEPHPPEHPGHSVVAHEAPAAVDEANAHHSAHGPEHVEEDVEVYVQAQGRPAMVLIAIRRDAAVRDLVLAAANAGLAIAVGDGRGGEVVVSVEDADEPLRLDVRLSEGGVGHRGRVHLHHARRIDVVVHFNGRQVAHEFSPAATIARVFAWAVGLHGFALAPLDATEHALQVTGTHTRPGDDVHLGTLVAADGRDGHHPHAVAFDLVPKQRVEG